MRKQITFILLLALVCVLVACGDKEIDKKEDEMVQVEQSESDVTEESSSLQQDTPAEEPSQQNSDEGATEEAPTSSTGSLDNTNNTQKPSTGSTTKPSTGSTNNSGSTDNSGNTGSTQNNNTSTTTPSKPAHTHSWTEVKETVVVQEAWVEDVYGWRTICGKCGLDMTNMTDEELTIHCSCVCNSCYSAKYIKYDEINHPAVTEEQVTGYKCECGATKK